MSGQVPTTVAHGAARDAEHSFVPEFAWSAVGGGAALAACIVLVMLTASWGGPLPGGGAPPISAYARELAGAFLAGFLVVLVVRSLSARAR